VNTTVVNNYYNTTVINKTTVNNVTYVNQRVPGAVSATTPQAFTSAQSVSKNTVKVDAREVATAQVVATTPAVAPSRQAVLGSGATAVVHPPATLQARAVVAKTTPPPPPPSFAKQQQAIQANGGKPLAISQMHQIQPEPVQARAAIKIAPPAKPLATQAKGVQPSPNRPVTPNNPSTTNTVNKGGNPPVTNTSGKSFSDRPPASRPNTPANATNTTNTPTTPNNTKIVNPVNTGNPANNIKTVNPPAVNPQLEQKHQQQLQDMRAQQDLERQKVEQQQQKDRAALAKKAADDAAQQKLNQQHQQQLEQLEQKHNAEEAKLKQQQQVERKNPPPPAKPPKEDKPPKKDKP
jgi:hypothetical protein